MVYIHTIDKHSILTCAKFTDNSENNLNLTKINYTSIMLDYLKVLGSPVYI